MIYIQIQIFIFISRADFTKPICHKINSIDSKFDDVEIGNVKVRPCYY